MGLLRTPKLDTANDRVAARIRGHLGERGASQAELARALNVAAMWVSDRLSGKTAISVNDLDRIAEALGMEAADLMPPRPNADDRARTAVRESDKRVSGARPSRPPKTPRTTSTRPGHGKTGPNSSQRTSRIW